MIWYKLWVAYSVRGLRLADGTLLPHAELEALDIDIKIDISPIDPYSVLSRELSLENALAQQHITFEEYVEALDDNSGVPKDKFRAILDRRRGGAPEQSEMRPNGSKRRGASAGPRQAELGGVADIAPAGALPGMELVGSGVPGGLPGAGMSVQGGAGLFRGWARRWRKERAEEWKPRVEKRKAPLSRGLITKSADGVTFLMLRK